MPRLVPPSISFDLTPLAWQEMYLHYDEKSIRSKKDLLEYLRESEKCYDWIKNNIESRNISKRWGFRIRDLLVGYCLLDLGDWTGHLGFEKRKMWELFEDLVYEIFREALRRKHSCLIVPVDGLSGFKGLDFVVINQTDEDWNVGIQCKRYISTGIPASKMDKYGPYSRNVSAAVLTKKSQELRERYRSKKIVLTTFDIFYENQQQFNRFQNLKNRSQWDRILVFNKPQSPIYKYRLNCDGLETVIDWC